MLIAELDWGLLLKGVGAAAGLLGLFFALPKLRLTRRTTIKTDLEILELLRKTNDPLCDRVDDHIRRRMEALYPPPDLRTDPVKVWMVRIGSAAGAVGLTIWTMYLNRDGFSGWSILTGLYALVFSVNLVAPGRNTGLFGLRDQLRKGPEQ